MSHSTTVTPPNPELAALPNLFLLDPPNRAFVAGKTKRINMSEGWITYPFVFLLALLALPILYEATHLWREGNWGVAIFFMVICSVIGYSVARFLLRVCRARHLTNDGHLIQGELVNCRTTKHDDDYSEGYPVVVIEFEFCFQSHDGRKICTTKRRTLSEKAFANYLVSETGIPVAALYVNDKLYKVL